MRNKASISAIMAAVVALTLAVPSLLQAHEKQRAQPEPGQAPQTMGQGTMGQGMGQET